MNTWRKRGRTKKQVNKRRAQELLPRTPLAETQQTILNCVIVWCQRPVSGFLFFVFCYSQKIQLKPSAPTTIDLTELGWNSVTGVRWKETKQDFFFLKHSHDPFQSTTFHNETPTPTLHSKCLPCCSYLQKKGWSFSEKVGWEVGGGSAPRRRGTTSSCEWRRTISSHLLNSPAVSHLQTLHRKDLRDVREKNLMKSSPS